MSKYDEVNLEHDVLDILGELSWEPLEGKYIAKGSDERESWEELIIPHRLREAIEQINPDLPDASVQEAVDRVLSPESTSLEAENARIHGYLTDGIRISYLDEFGVEQNPTVRLVDHLDPYRNDFLAVNQVTVRDGDERCRFDVVLYVNGLPLAFIELKKMGDPYATVETGHGQLMRYTRQVWKAFRCNVICLSSDGVLARYGTAFTPYNHFAPWNVDDAGKPVPQPAPTWDQAELSLALYGLFEPRRFIELLGGYVAFSQDDKGRQKRIAKPHQYFAVSKAVEKTIEAVRSNGKAGVVWHTQGSGKSMEMELYANQVLRHPALGNPTIVVITDRTDLDDQLFDGFNASELLPEKPRQVTSRDELRTGLINRRTGGIYFTTLQKFSRTKQEKDAGRQHPLLSDRRNVIVIVDEAHRSHYDDLDGYARHLRDALPYATMIAFTGTPISKAERDTTAVFGDYIDIYDLTRAVRDGATVPVFYESRLIPVSLPSGVDAEELDEAADKATEGLDDAERARMEQAVTALNAVYGAPDRLDKLAADIVAHWETRSEAMKEFIGVSGKGMIVCSTRDICADLYEQIVALRPDWHGEGATEGKIKVVYSTSADDKTKKEHLLKHRLRPSEHKTVQRRMKEAGDDLELIIVKDMLLTGFDAPPLHTLYLDRTMRGAQLMQTLARVNRTYKNKQDGLMVGYAPLHDNLLEALAEYTDEDQHEKPMGRDTDIALAAVHDTIDVLCRLLSGYPWRDQLSVGGPTAYRDAVWGAANYLRDPQHPDNQVDDPDEPTLKERFAREASRLSRFYALCRTSGELNGQRDDIGFFHEVRVCMAKFDAAERQSEGRPIPADVELMLKHITAGAIEAGEVTDLFSAAGLERPNLANLDESYVKHLQAARNPALAIEALRRLVQQEMRKVTKHNVVRQKNFSDRLIDLMRKYTSQNITAAEVIAKLIEMAREISADADRGKRFDPPLDDAQLAFYDAVAAKGTVAALMGHGDASEGEKKLAAIARDLVRTVRNNLSPDWIARDDVQAKLRSIIKRLLAKHGYPPEEERDAIEKVIQQLDTFADEWAPGAE
ncbi:type I restriction endonuclease subunit R [Nocardia sp. CDC159]|uniref:Type I restriction enzyme endonuclease subunit n=1 Tax=Nocardia pulmonis TaxID=2951408 RepID=A0A9X2J1L5_9NOCA|nr:MULTISPECIES: type I restriction endonuclease subunit R [Nocardia]MCM6777146.1 type I restriction endonuclease subunit R [Nocardia pulmonis]MCM6790031.1 type I restriction endonuclease subunit R [Nocardia sp. CDC159]